MISLVEQLGLNSWDWTAGIEQLRWISWDWTAGIEQLRLNSWEWKAQMEHLNLTSGIEQLGLNSYVEQLRLICSDRSGQMSDCERVAQVAHQKWRCEQFTQVAHQKRELWLNHSGCSPKMREWAPKTDEGIPHPGFSGQLNFSYNHFNSIATERELKKLCTAASRQCTAASRWSNTSPPLSCCISCLQ